MKKMSVRVLGRSLEFKNYALNPAAHPNLAQNLESTPTNHANKTTNSSNCSMALEALSELGGRSYLSDMTIHHNSLNRSNCIDKGEFLQNTESTKNTNKNTAEVSCNDFVGYQGEGEGSVYKIHDQALAADSRKSTQNKRSEACFFRKANAYN